MWKGTYFGKIEGHMIVPLSFFITLSSHGIRGIFDPLKNLTKHCVCMELSNIFTLFSQNWWTRLNFNFCRRFYHLPMHRVLLWQIQNGVSKLSYHASMPPYLCHAKNWDDYGVHIVVSILWYRLKFWPLQPVEKSSWCHVNISNGNIGLLWTIILITTTNLTKWLFLIKFNV